MAPVGKHSGPAPDRARMRRFRGRRLRFALAALGTFLAWAVLVYFAIQIGSQVREEGSGSPTAWVLLVIALIGAVCCLFLALQLVGKLLDRNRPAGAAEHDAAPAPRPVGGRRARR